MKVRTYMIEEDLYKEFKKKCIDTDTTPSSFIRKKIKEYVKYKSNYGKDNKN